MASNGKLNKLEDFVISHATDVNAESVKLVLSTAPIGLVLECAEKAGNAKLAHALKARMAASRAAADQKANAGRDERRRQVWKYHQETRDAMSRIEAKLASLQGVEDKIDLLLKALDIKFEARS